MTAAGKVLLLGIVASIGLAVYAVGFANRFNGSAPPPLKAALTEPDAQTRGRGDAEPSRPAAQSNEPTATAASAEEPDAEFGVLVEGNGVRPTQIANTDEKVLKALAACDSALAAGKYLEAWEGYNTVCKMGLTPTDSRIVKAKINTVSDTLLFGSFRPERDDNFPVHTVRVGERLGTIAPKYNMPWEGLVRMNHGLDPSRVGAGRTLKLVRGPLHIVVYKSEYELDLLLDGKVVRAYAVGLGQNNSTPVGKFTVRNKMKNPPYTHPRTNERFAAGDPKNPVGTRWMALEGADEVSRKFHGYAIHGTIEPDTICRQASLGCVRMLREDVEELYDLVTQGATTVEIRE